MRHEPARRGGAPTDGDRRRGRLVAPTTALGRRSLGLLAVAACFWVAMAAAIGAGVRGDSPTALEIAFLAIPAVAGGLSMIAAGAVAVTAVRRGDRSLRLAVPIVLGALALLFAAGEVFAPH